MGADLVDSADRQIAQTEGAVSGADEAADFEAEMFEDSADLAVLAFLELHLDPLVAAGAALQIGVDGAVAHAVDLDSVDQLLELLLADLSEGAGAVGALDSGRGKLELAFQLAVGRKEKKALSIIVEAADRDEARKALGKAVVDGRAALGVTLCGERSGRLVEAEQARRGGVLDRLAVDGDSAKGGEDGRGGFEDLAVNGDAAFGDHPLDLAARGDARAGEKLGYSLAVGFRA
jgi:hypothetical protein